MFYKYNYPCSNLLDIFSIYYLTTVNSNKIRNMTVKKLSNIEHTKKIIQDNECTCISEFKIYSKIIASLESV